MVKCKSSAGLDVGGKGEMGSRTTSAFLVCQLDCSAIPQAMKEDLFGVNDHVLISQA